MEQKCPDSVLPLKAAHPSPELASHKSKLQKALLNHSMTLIDLGVFL